jgi:hypothetical protein
MTVTGTDVEASAPGEPPARARGGALGVFRDPLRTFLVLAIPIGVYLACVVPHFGGIDEPAHFYRAYQISTGSFLPEKFGASQFSGACIPIDVILARQRDSSVYAAHLRAIADIPPDPNVPPITASRVPRCPTDRSLGLVTFSTFGSPVPYLPQAAAVFVTRSLGTDTDTMLIVARLVVLVTYLALVAIAIRRSPRSKWALCAVGLLPIAVIQAASSVSHDAFTTAVALLVVSSALRAVDPPPGTSTRALVIEALVLSTLLGLCKPVYVVVAACYLLPLLGSRRVKERWPLVFAPALGVAVSVAWNQAVGGLWKTDAGYFGIRVDDVTQRHELLHAPWDFAGDLVRTVYHQLWLWTQTQVSVGGSITRGPAILAVLAVLVYAACSLLRDRTEAAAPLHWLQRTLILLVFLAGVVVVAAANYVYWTEPGSSQIGGIQSRYLTPLLVLLPAAIGPLPFRWARAADARFPVAALLAPVLLVFCVMATFRMY